MIAITTVLEIGAFNIKQLIGQLMTGVVLNVLIFRGIGKWG